MYPPEVEDGSEMEECPYCFEMVSKTELENHIKDELGIEDDADEGEGGSDAADHKRESDSFDAENNIPSCPACEMPLIECECRIEDDGPLPHECVEAEEAIDPAPEIGLAGVCMGCGHGFQMCNCELPDTDTEADMVCRKDARSPLLRVGIGRLHRAQSSPPTSSGKSGKGSVRFSDVVRVVSPHAEENTIRSLFGTQSDSQEEFHLSAITSSLSPGPNKDHQKQTISRAGVVAAAPRSPAARRPLHRVTPSLHIDSASDEDLPLSSARKRKRRTIRDDDDDEDGNDGRFAPAARETTPVPVAKQDTWKGKGKEKVRGGQLSLKESIKISSQDPPSRWCGECGFSLPADLWEDHLVHHRGVVQSTAGSSKKYMCDECQKYIDISQKQEHEDWHFSMKLQEEPAGKARGRDDTVEFYCKDCNVTMPLSKKTEHIDYHIALDMSNNESEPRPKSEKRSRKGNKDSFAQAMVDEILVDEDETEQIEDDSGDESSSGSSDIDDGLSTSMDESSNSGEGDMALINFEPSKKTPTRRNVPLVLDDDCSEDGSVDMMPYKVSAAPAPLPQSLRRNDVSKNQVLKDLTLNAVRKRKLPGMEKRSAVGSEIDIEDFSDEENDHNLHLPRDEYGQPIYIDYKNQFAPSKCRKIVAKDAHGALEGINVNEKAKAAPSRTRTRKTTTKRVYRRKKSSAGKRQPAKRTRASKSTRKRTTKKPTARKTLRAKKA